MQSRRVVVITGAGGGIGGKIVSRFLENGDHVIALDRDQSSLDRLASSRTSHGRLDIARADVTDLSGIEGFRDRLQSSHGRLDVLINCAGFYPTVAFEEMTPDGWQQIITINLTGAFNMVHTLLSLLKGRGWGRIVNIGSGSVFDGVVGQTHYVSAKAGIVGLSRSLAMELGKDGITVNTVAPGLTLTKPVIDSVSKNDLQKQVEGRAIKRDEHPEDLAGPVFLLCSPDADFVTGQMLVVDGGRTKH